MNNICVDINEQGFLFATASPISECTSYILISRSNYDSFLSGLTVTAEDIATSFSFGFMAVIVVGYFAAWPVGIAKSLINKL